MSSSEDERTNDRTTPGPSARLQSPSPQTTSQLMTAITASQSVVDAKLQQFREEIRRGQEEAAAKAVKRARYEKPYTFRRREYTADDSDDEKRIERAEKAAEKKAENGGGSAVRFLGNREPPHRVIHPRPKPRCWVLFQVCQSVNLGGKWYPR